MPLDKAPSNQKYLDPLVYRTFPGTTIKGALPRRRNPNYVKPPSYIERLKKWINRAPWRKM